MTEVQDMALELMRRHFRLGKRQGVRDNRLYRMLVVGSSPGEHLCCVWGSEGQHCAFLLWCWRGATPGESKRPRVPVSSL